MIEVIVDPQQLEAMRARLAYIANGATKALYRALNKTASKARTEASKMIRATELRVPASYLNERDGSGARRLSGPADGFEFKANSTKLVAKLSARKRGTRLDRFLVSPPPTKKGKPEIGEEPRVSVKPGHGEKTIWGAFYISAKNSGGYLIVMRDEVLRSMGHRYFSGRLGYQALYTTSVHDALQNVIPAVSELMSPYLAARLQAETEWLIEQNPPPAGDGSEDAA